MRYAALLTLLAAALPSGHAQIRRVDIVHLSHMDVGFTDHPSVTREMQKKYLDMALAAAEADPGFAWTAESLLAVEEWWESAPADRRAALVAMIDAGRIGIGALPFNNTPFLDAAQWRRMLDWVPDDLWNRLRPAAAVQNDVNGMPRAGVMRLLDRGVRRMMMGLNNDSGGSPLSRPAAFWWRMPDGRRMFVCLGDSYPAGYNYFHQGSWRRGPVCRASPRRSTACPARAISFQATKPRCARRTGSCSAG